MLGSRGAETREAETQKKTRWGWRRGGQGAVHCSEAWDGTYGGGVYPATVIRRLWCSCVYVLETVHIFSYLFL
jgi:hypothetical protein